MMHRARLTINTSNACLVNKFNSLNSNSPNGGARPYTPPPPSCRLHKIYEEKLEVLGVLGHENWFDDNANPFYRHAEPELIYQPSGRTNNANTADDSASDGPNKDPSTVGSVNIVIKTTPASMARSRKPRLGDDNTQSIEFTGFESLESDSEPEEVIDSFWKGNEAEEMHSFFSKGYRDVQNNQMSNDKNEDNGEKMSPRTEMEYRRLSNRNRIMDRGRLMPDTALMMSFPLRREPRYVIGAPKVRALSPYPRRTFEF